MSLLPKNRGPHVRDLFVNSTTTGPGPTLSSLPNADPNHTTTESRTSYDLSGKKKGRAPPPPTVSLGQYKPKILSQSEGTANVLLLPGKETRGDSDSNNNNGLKSSHGDVTYATPSSSSSSSKNGDVVFRNGDVAANSKTGDVLPRKAVVIGDKDTPLVLPPPAEEPESPQDGQHLLELQLNDLTLQSPLLGEGRRVEEGVEGMVGTSNPLFDLHLAPEHTVNDNEGEDVPVSNGKLPHHYIKRKDQSRTEDFVRRDRTKIDDLRKEEEEAQPDGEPEGVFIPAPDYDEVEKTMMFSDDTDDDEDLVSEPPPPGKKKVYKEYQGEDFAQYMSDEELDMGEILWSKKPTKKKNVPLERKAKTEVKRSSHYKKRESLVTSGKDAGKKEGSYQGSSSLRNFSYADSKFGTINGLGGRQRNVQVAKVSKGEAELFVDSGSSYEHFLCSKSGDQVPAASPEGDVDPVRLRYPDPARNPPNNSKKETVWKRLTWKFKK